MGLWGADPPRAYYASAANLLVRRLRPAGAAGNPWDIADSTGNILRYPVMAARTREGVQSRVRGGLEDAEARVSR
jgi:hypothetical protein